MMRSLWAGVTGLQAHQIAMDVEGNNIANVNTTGFKYSRANFSDLLSQTAKIATAPQGELGGKNAMQIGLGTQISTVTKIFKQGSIETTDKTTDLAIQGDGFFIVSPDAGSTYKYTRSGDFTFDANGNFVDTNGYIAQGWVRDKVTGNIDSTSPIGNITIPPGLTTPANASTYIGVKANLDSGNNVGSKISPIYQLDQYNGWYDKNTDGTRNLAAGTAASEVHNENDAFDNYYNTSGKLVERGMDMGALFSATGDAFSLRNGQGIWVSYAEAKWTSASVTTFGQLDITLNNTTISGPVSSVGDIINAINEKTSATGIVAQLSGTDQITFVNTNKTGTEENTKNIKLTLGATNTVNGISDTIVNTAYQYAYSSSFNATAPDYNDTTVRKFTTTEDLRNFMQTDARLNVNYQASTVATTGAWGGATALANKNDGVAVIVNDKGQFQINNPSGDAINTDDGDIFGGTTLATARTIPAGVAFLAGDFVNNSAAPITIAAADNSTGAAITIPVGGQLLTPFTLTNPVTLPIGTTFINNLNIDTVDQSQEMYLSVTGLSNASSGISVNTLFTSTMEGIQGAIPTGTSYRTSQGVYAASHASSIDVYDSLGSKHTVRFEFTKTGFTDSGGTEWSVQISVPAPGKINSAGSTKQPENIITGTISFNSDGSLSTFAPTNLTYTANNGSTPNQNIQLRFGTSTQFDGMTSFDKDSNTSGISQDGYAGGDLNGLSVDETGTVIGSFTNGRSFGLAQIAMATFTNNQGLESDGGNCFVQTSNSGDPIVGQASTGGKGKVQASSLEMSNVDLSRSLTQLIVIQRGYQANSKTITTADEMLNTLLQLK
ncbi:Flagellar hook protein FlgE [Sulfurospirillum sp. 'SP']|nr:flagellar hook protein FlgE [Sulfurospirillum sp. 'SP']WNZ00247.1 Flagellar hook protein FlgE [Sulfurospirillum sp. 'SP']